MFKKRFGIKKVYELYGSAEGTLIFTNLLNLDRTVGMCLTPYAIVKYDIDAEALSRAVLRDLQVPALARTPMVVKSIMAHVPLLDCADLARI